MGGTATWQAMRTIAAVTPNTLFPTACKMANGDVILVTPRMTHHLYGDGEIWAMTGTDNGNGTVTWRNDWTKIYARKGSTWDVRASICAQVPSGPHAGKVVVTIADTNWVAGSLAVNYASSWPTAKVACYTRILISTDATCTAWEELATLPPAFPDLVAEGVPNDFPECPVVFLPNGDWMTATYSRETHDYIGWYSSAYFRSTDNGATWEHEGFVDRANTSNPVQSTAHMADEPQLLMLANGEMLCVIRTLEEGRNEAINGYEHYLWRCSNPTDRGAMVWVNEGVCTNEMAGSRPALLQHSNEMVLHGFRVIAGSGTVASVQGAYCVSNDDGDTWTAERNLDTGGLTSGNSGTGVYSYGAWVELSDGSLIHVYCNDNSSSSTTREARFSVVSDTPAASGYGSTSSSGYGTATTYTPPSSSLTVDPASTAWEQIGTQLVVRVTADPSTVAATIYSRDGGLVRYGGTDADLFEVSLDGMTWSPMVDVPAGETAVQLRVTPEAPGTTLSAEIGVPV